MTSDFEVHFGRVSPLRRQTSFRSRHPAVIGLLPASMPSWHAAGYPRVSPTAPIETSRLVRMSTTCSDPANAVHEPSTETT